MRLPSDNAKSIKSYASASNSGILRHWHGVIESQPAGRGRGSGCHGKALGGMIPTARRRQAAGHGKLLPHRLPLRQANIALSVRSAPAAVHIHGLTSDVAAVAAGQKLDHLWGGTNGTKASALTFGRSRWPVDNQQPMCLKPPLHPPCISCRRR